MFGSKADIDECETRTSNCSESAKCEDTDGSFLCKCNIGFSGDGISCVGKFAVLNTEKGLIIIGEHVLHRH